MFDFLGFLNNPLILLAIACPVILLVGILLGHIVSQPKKNRVIKVSPESGRGVELQVREEDSTNLYCDPVGSIPPQRFIKRLNAFTIIKKGWFKLQNYACWFARYGTAYVQGFSTDPIKISLKTAILNIFGEKLYKQIPLAQKTQIEKAELGVVIEFPNDPLTPEGLSSISEDDLNRDADERAMRNMWEGFESEKRSDKIQMLFILGSGIAIGIVLSLIFKWGTPIIIPPTPTA